ncbi:MAG: signal peptidase II [Bdellovibrionales bacterium]
MKYYFTIGTYLLTLVALIDQVSKWWVVKTLYLTETSFIKLTSFFNIVLSWNKGITFGLFNQHSSWGPYILIGVTLIIVLLLLFWLANATTLYESLGLGLILGGAIGNIADRLHYGAVVDFLDFHYAGYHWYAFNIADSAIVAGVGLLMLDNLVLSKENK